MRRQTYRPYLFLGIFFIGILNLPLGWTNGGRASIVSFASSFSIGSNGTSTTPPELENLLIRKQNQTLRNRLLSEERVEHQLEKLKSLEILAEKKTEEFFKRRQHAAEALLSLELYSLFAQVTYRSSASWNSTLWINVGERDNTSLQEKIVAVNSPVLKGQYLIGVVEYVGKTKSRVRLFTDSTLIPSVRVARGGSKNREILELLDILQEQLSLRDETHEELASLESLKQKLNQDLDERYLAKGELYGTSSPLWRGCSSTLKGIGFNYDFSDEEGPALELRSGKPLDRLSTKEEVALIKKGDLLVTTGMDGVFPSDLPVALVSSIEPLQEGAVAFEIEAKLCAGNLHNLRDVTVLPPLSFLEEAR